MAPHFLTILSQIVTRGVFVSVTCSGIFNLKKRRSRDIYLNLRLRFFCGNRSDLKSLPIPLFYLVNIQATTKFRRYGDQSRKIITKRFTVGASTIKSPSEAFYN